MSGLRYAHAPSAVTLLEDASLLEDETKLEEKAVLELDEFFAGGTEELLA